MLNILVRGVSVVFVTYLIHYASSSQGEVTFNFLLGTLTVDPPNMHEHYSQKKSKRQGRFFEMLLIITAVKKQMKIILFRIFL